ncbi:ASCH domain-containing protein [Brucella sp. BO3]|uniref:ASCH domain-containing protein n=1 Tax=unclassified Brucella TaxID=2632610 RepID=UPI00084FA147|nr:MULTISPECIES: ASCH domain-containing protein [unclassified Brucella]OEI83700.1 hypothetical protein BA060_06905 [Brucella sp. B13-0095]QMV26533.1 ASCH domain-containing protein [Brucella sp. BO3]
MKSIEKSYPELPDLALSIQQPWAWLIVNGHKDIENRSWRTSRRGLVAIHAGKKVDRDAAIDLQMCLHPVTGTGMEIDTFAAAGKGTGGIVGVAEIVDCVECSNSDWFVGELGFVIRNAQPVEFIPCKGSLGFFDWRKQLEIAL